MGMTLEAIRKPYLRQDVEEHGVTAARVRGVVHARQLTARRRG
jgi:hypothetical protein